MALIVTLLVCITAVLIALLFRPVLIDHLQKVRAHRSEELNQEQLRLETEMVLVNAEQAKARAEEQTAPERLALERARLETAAAEERARKESIEATREEAIASRLRVIAARETSAIEHAREHPEEIEGMVTAQQVFRLWKPSYDKYRAARRSTRLSAYTHIETRSPEDWLGDMLEVPDELVSLEEQAALQVTYDAYADELYARGSLPQPPSKYLGTLLKH